MRRREVARAFGHVLREVRHERGISQDKLAELADVDRTFRSLLERGLRTPTLAMLFRLADALAVHAGELAQRAHDRLKYSDRPCAKDEPSPVSGDGSSEEIPPVGDAAAEERHAGNDASSGASFLRMQSHQR